MTKPIAILGCGPAGLMAAQACSLAGRPFVIFSQPDKSKLGGAQFLHRHIPLLTNPEPDAMITYLLAGDEQSYRDKVYGLEPVPFTSFSSVKNGEQQAAWSLVNAYDQLWDRFKLGITPQQIDGQWLEGIVEEGDFELIFSTVPLPIICRRRGPLFESPHKFRVQNIHILPKKFAAIPDNTIVYDGTDKHTWYRASNLFGVYGTEWSDKVPKPPLAGLITDRKPIATTCDCFRDSVIRLGRRGTWVKGVLTHDAFFDALDWFV